ncbi:MAG: hypothetical protein IT331_05815 [Anaerolineae bacterium]|nr:hypothetical protein [Anaerolineae bacterium]
MVVIDTDVLLLEFAFQNDARQAANTASLKAVQTAEPAITIYNLMELLGQLSFNLAPSKLDNWRTWLLEVYRLSVISPVDMNDPDAVIRFMPEIFEQPYTRMRSRRMGYLDALTLNLAERTLNVSSFVTWNARHFKGKSSLQVLTPQEYLDLT